jgi:hypothetical protein
MASEKVVIAYEKRGNIDDYCRQKDISKEK